jgi:hypothetical protein
MSPGRGWMLVIVRRLRVPDPWQPTESVVNKFMPQQLHPRLRLLSLYLGSGIAAPSNPGAGLALSQS